MRLICCLGIIIDSNLKFSKRIENLWRLDNSELHALRTLESTYQQKKLRYYAVLLLKLV